MKHYGFATIIVRKFQEDLFQGQGVGEGAVLVTEHSGVLGLAVHLLSSQACTSTTELQFTVSHRQCFAVTETLVSNLGIRNTGGAPV